MCFSHILHGSISRFDVLLHGQLASHNAQSATELGVKGHTRMRLEENELDSRGGREEIKKEGEENPANGNEIFQGSFYCDGSKDIRDFYYYYK